MLKDFNRDLQHPHSGSQEARLMDSFNGFPRRPSGECLAEPPGALQTPWAGSAPHAQAMSGNTMTGAAAVVCIGAAIGLGGRLPRSSSRGWLPIRSGGATDASKRGSNVCSHEMLGQSTPPAARGSEIHAGQNMNGAPTATRTLDLPLRRSSHVLRSTAALLMSAGFRVVWLPLGVRRFRPVLARLWHGSGGQHLIRRNLGGLRSPAKAALACRNVVHRSAHPDPRRFPWRSRSPPAM
jgi:hypothetical protein